MCAGGLNKLSLQSVTERLSERRNKIQNSFLNYFFDKVRHVHLHPLLKNRSLSYFILQV